MTPYHQRVFLLPAFAILWIAAFSACQREDSGNTNSTAWTGNYVAHVELDSTTLIATEITNSLESPWDLSIDPEGWIWFTEIEGKVSRVNPQTGEQKTLLQIPDVYLDRARGLMSSALHPDFEENPHIYLHYTFAQQELGSRLVRYTFDGDTLTDPQIILDELPGGIGHNGSRLMIGPDNKLWMGVGDSNRGDLAQNPETWHGKVLRMNLDGTVPDDNPYGNLVWSTGHRNIQGITHGNGQIYISEHGPASDDEINLILPERNYGWPDVQGYCDSPVERQYCRDSLIVEPIMAFNPVVAPAGIGFYEHDAIPEWKNTLLLSTLRTQTLRVLRLSNDGSQVDEEKIYFQQQFGRLRDVAVDANGRVFLLTSSTDWYRESRPEIHDPSHVEQGDRIIMLQAADEAQLAQFHEVEDRQTLRENHMALYLGDSDITDNMSASQQLYMTHCAACHRPDGSGMEGLAPPLTDSERLSGNREGLLRLMLTGIPSDERSGYYDWDMPAYRNLDNDEIAAILNYIGGEFSTQMHTFRPDDVEEMRKEL